MIAPIDAKATFDAGGEPITLQMNFRTIALAEAERPDVVGSFGRGKPTLSGIATLVWAFAQPAHPDLSQDQALALVMQYGEAVGDTLRRVFETGSAKASADAHPRRGSRGKPPSSTA